MKNTPSFAPAKKRGSLGRRNTGSENSSNRAKNREPRPKKDGVEQEVGKLSLGNMGQRLRTKISKKLLEINGIRKRRARRGCRG